MFKDTNETIISKSNVFTNILVMVTINALLFTQALARDNSDTTNVPVYSISQGGFTSELSKNNRKDIIATNKLSKNPDQLTNRATSNTREQMLASHKTQVVKSAKSLITQQSTNDYYADFAIYSATSFLEDDFDGDGFYQTFSVVFDADIYSYSAKQWGEVYALLYLSKNGGPWVHYYTTDSFIIDGESDSDEYEVITTFLSGYSTDYYDVLIDLYQMGYNDVVASYSSDDNNALYALTLESADYDEPYIEVVEVYGGGSFSIISLFILLISGALRLGLKPVPFEIKVF